MISSQPSSHLTVPHVFALERRASSPLHALSVGLVVTVELLEAPYYSPLLLELGLAVDELQCDVEHVVAEGAHEEHVSLLPLFPIEAFPSLI